ncbi:hypothetical protein KM043_012889 [Ampulex compressa]|nr:hypothetical protein KM043_012889 [Ampulex compressa]
MIHPTQLPARFPSHSRLPAHSKHLIQFETPKISYLEPPPGASKHSSFARDDFSLGRGSREMIEGPPRADSGHRPEGQNAGSAFDSYLVEADGSIRTL